jgi:hypothetical protein
VGFLQLKQNKEWFYTLQKKDGQAVPEKRIPTSGGMT